MKKTNLTPVVSGYSIKNVYVGAEGDSTRAKYGNLNKALEGIDAATDRLQKWNSEFIAPIELPTDSQLSGKTDGLMEKTPYEIIEYMFTKQTS